MLDLSLIPFLVKQVTLGITISQAQCSVCKMERNMTVS